MSKVVPLLAAATAVLAGICVYLAFQLRSERAARAPLDSEHQAYDAPAPIADPIAPPTSIAFEPATPTATPREQATPRWFARPGDAAPAAPMAMTDPARASAEEEARAERERQQRSLENPQYAAALAAIRQRGVRQMFPDLAQAVGLTPEEESQLIDLLARQRFVSSGPGFADDEPETAALRRGQEQGVRALLGEDRYGKWQHYRDTLGARMDLRQFRGELAVTRTEALSDEQYEAIVAAWSDERRRYGRELWQMRYQDSASGSAPGMPEDERQLSLARDREQRMREVVSAYLSAGQLARYDRMVEERLQMQHQAMIISREEEAARAPDGASQTPP